MATPNFDILHTRLAARINDPAATGGTAGSIYSVAERSRYLNQASNFLFTWLYQFDRNKARDILQSVYKSASATFVDHGWAVSGATGYTGMHLGVSRDSDGSVFTYWPRKEELDGNLNPNLANAYTIEAGLLYVYQNGTVLDGVAGKFKYLASDECTEGGATDISITSNLWDVIVDIAVTFALEEVGQVDNTVAFATRIQTVVNVLKGQ